MGVRERLACWWHGHAWYVIGPHTDDTLHIGCERCGRGSWYCFNISDPSYVFRINSESRLALAVQKWRGTDGRG